jgi:TetR/AcrR family transcriptional regulator, fatty acid metabolism regulator protein
LDQPVKKRVRKSKSVRKREIAEAALKIMSRHGYYGTSVARIAKAVGISNSALYQHFGSREEVLIAAIELISEQAHDWILAPQGATAAERLENIAQSHLTSSAAAVESFVRPIFALVSVTERARAEPSTPRGVMQSYELILPIVKEGQREGSIRSDVEAGDLAWAILMFAWAEDMALLAHVDQVTDQGASQRNFKRLLSVYASPQAGGGTAKGEPSGLS